MSAAKLLPELLRAALYDVFNLASLHELLRASPVASSQSATHGSTIFEAILSSRHIHDQICALIRVAALVQSGSSPPQVPINTAGERRCSF
ncbi:hypothetical protein GQ53DRAFT_265058 [Thozetella sp. PMI_491]|nr:hypothetical protein GQ53DRAFT_265058 [Thozetella sp. PMI_491]